MPNQEFRFRQFTIRQDKAAMKVGTDSILLGAWVNVPDCGKILDIGTGTGILALMMAQRCEAEISAIEPEEQAFRQAQENVAASVWNQRISLVNTSLQEFSKENKFDAVICNPPYFENQLQAPDAERNLARHALGLNFRELIENICLLLKGNGFFSVVIPYESAQKFTGIAIENGFCCSRHTRVKPNPEKDFNRSLLEFSRIQGECEIRELTVSTMIRHQYTAEYKALTRDFYLWFLDEKA